MSERTDIRMSAQAYITLPETSTPTELLDGAVMMSPSRLIKHQKIVQHLHLLFHALLSQIGGEVYIAPVDVVLDDENVVQPDVLWLAPESQCQVTETHLIHAPELVIEVMSPGSQRRDRVTKFRLYERYGVREYWLIQPDGDYMEVFTRQADALNLMGVYASGETFESPLLGARIATSEIFGASSR